MFETLLKLLAAGLSIWESKEKRKYVDKMMKLKNDWYHEFNKPDDIRSSSALDHIEWELRVLSLSFASEVGAKDVGN